jgi:hypothetical protein
MDSFVPKPGRGKATTFNKSQKKAVLKGAQTVEHQDNAMWSALKRKPKLGKILMAIAAISSQVVGAIGQVTTFVDPGWHGTDCTEQMIEGLNKTIETQDPSVLYVHVPFADDKCDNPDYDRLKSFVANQMDAGRTCIVADTRHTSRWSSVGEGPALCRGDLAFHCNNKNMCNELVEWAKERDNGNPRCTDDLEETQFADVLAGLAECHHMDKCVDTAFVGTEEAAAEADPHVFDGIFGPEDEALPNSTDVFDDEQDLLERIPLPGNPQKEQERNRLWLALPRRARIAIRRLHRNFKHLPKKLK